MSFARAVRHVLNMEGGLVQNPQDPGGRTNRGITQRTLDARRKVDPSLPATVDELTLEQTTGIYQAIYWKAIHGDELPDPVAFALLDYAVNSGPSQAIRSLQHALKMNADGIMGPGTIAAAASPGTVSRLSVERIYFLTDLATWSTFGRGWAKRVIDTAIEAFEA